MSVIQRMLQLLSSDTRKLRAYETEVVTSIRSIVSPLARPIIDTQLRNIAFIQRHVNDKEVNLYLNEKYGVDNRDVFQCPFSEWPIGVVYCSASHYPSPLRATVWAANGTVFSIIFSQSPIDSAISILKTQVLFDPTASAFQEKWMSQSVPDSDSVRQLIPAVEENSIIPPLESSLREQFLVPTENCLPIEYSKLLRYTNGCRVGQWQIHGLPLREVAMEESNLFVLAESTGVELLCAKDGDTERNIYLWNLEDHLEIPLGLDFRRVLSSKTGY